MKKYKPKFPILIKHKKIFVWYGNRWMNISMQIMIHGEGFKGFKTFSKKIFDCAILKKHSFHKVFYVDTLEHVTECSYCHLRKENDEKTKK